MLDQRYENYQAPHRVDYTSPPYGGPGEPSHGYWQQMQQMRATSRRQRERHLQDRYGDPPYGQSDTFTNPFYPPKQHPNPRMRGMGGGLGGLQEEAAIPNWYKWYDKLINRFGEQKGSELWHQYAENDTGIGSTNEYQTAYSPGTYDDDDYGPFIAPSVIEMDLEGIDYDPADEYDYDRKRGWPGHVWDSPPVYSARGGLI